MTPVVVGSNPISHPILRPFYIRLSANWPFLELLGVNMEKWKTVDDERTLVSALNTGSEVDSAYSPRLRGRLRQFGRNASLVMAGMYTGLNCYGTPNAQHGQQGRSCREVNELAGKPDRRPI